MSRALIAALFLCALPAGAAVAQTPIRDEDAARLDAIDSTAGLALRQLFADGDAAQIKAVADALRGPAQPEARLDLAAIAGDWDCRMTKIGGDAGSISYPPFRCRIAVEGGEARFEKLTGSQRTRGTIRQDGGRIVYLGSTFVAGETPRPYADFPEVVETAGTETLPDAAIVEIAGPNRLRLLFPQPYRESLLNVLVLTR